MRKINTQITPLAAVVLALVLSACASGPRVVESAGCLNGDSVKAWADGYDRKVPVANPPATLTVADAACTRNKFRRHLSTTLGPLVGYKAGLTNPAVQKRFAHDQPVWGALYERMLVPSGSVIPAAFGGRPLYEADLLVRVKSEAINSAKTPAEVLAAVDQIIPFMELPDLMVQTPAPPALNGNGVTAINVGARLGIVGEPIPVPADAAAQARLVAQLASMKVRLVDDQGNALGGGTGSDVMGNPLNAVVWLSGALRAEGERMKVGQVISLGSFSALLSPKPGLVATVHYDGLNGAKPVTVRFR